MGNDLYDIAVALHLIKRCSIAIKNVGFDNDEFYKCYSDFASLLTREMVTHYSSDDVNFVNEHLFLFALKLD